MEKTFVNWIFGLITHSTSGDHNDPQSGRYPHKNKKLSFYAMMHIEDVAVYIML